MSPANTFNYHVIIGNVHIRRHVTYEDNANQKASIRMQKGWKKNCVSLLVCIVSKDMTKQWYFLWPFFVKYQTFDLIFTYSYITRHIESIDI